MSSQPILLVEDDEDLAEEIVTEFGRLAHRVVHVANGNAGLQQALSGTYSLVILDIELPGRNGFDICRELRREDPFLPVIMLTSRTAEIDRVLGFELGADDFVAKPFSMAELLARVRRKLSTTSNFRDALEGRLVSPMKQTISIGELTIDLERRKLFRGAVVIDLSAREFELVSLLMSAPGRVFTREELLRDVWGVQTMGYEEAIVSCVYRIRSKIEKDSNSPKYLLTVRGVGYCFAEPDTFATPDAT